MFGRFDSHGPGCIVRQSQGKAFCVEGFFGIIAQMVILFAIVAVGYVAKKINLMSEKFDKAFSKLILNVALPGLLIGSVLQSEQLPSQADILAAIIISCASYLLVFIIAYAVTFALRISQGYRGVFKFMLCFGNVGFIGFPVISAVFGSDALIYATIFNLPFNVLVFTVGIWFLLQDSEGAKKSETTWRTFLTPTIISCVVAIVLALLGIHQVPIVGDAFEAIGSLTTPGALMIIGSSLVNMPARRLLGGPRLWVMALFRLMLTPLCICGILHFFITDPLMLGVIVVITAMPVATNGTMLCYQYGGKVQVMAQGTFVTTVCSLISIPLLVQFLSVMG